MDGCIFCKIINKEIPAKLLYEDESAVAFSDINPQAPCHVLIVPKRHIDKISDLDKADDRLIGALILIAKNIAKEKGVESSGYRIVINCNKDAGQEVFHIHAHLLGGRKFAWPPG